MTGSPSVCLTTALVLAFVLPVGASESVASPGPTAPALPLTASVTDAVAAAMVDALQDEYKAEAMYVRVMRDIGEVRPFSNIVFAERRHADSIAKALRAHGLPVPENGWSPDEMPEFSTRRAACAAAATAERENIQLYDRFLELPMPADVKRVFSNNRAASLDNHLPAFERCR